MKKSPLLERHLVVQKCTKDGALEDLWMRLLAGKDCASGFVGIAAPRPPTFDTRLTVARQGDELVIAALLTTYQKFAAGAKPAYSGSVEVLFDLRNDGFGFTQWVFQEGETPFLNEFSPYPEARSTRSLPLRFRRWGYERKAGVNASHFATFQTLFYVVFAEADIFQFGPTVGFNFCRDDRASSEFSSWSFLAGNGAPDANSLGKLHRDSRSARRPRTAPLPPPERAFRVSITNDSPMVVINRHYTPASLDAEMRAIKSWGINRLHWVDYSNFPAFWAIPLWAKQYAATTRACGELLGAACRAARRHKVGLVPDFKLFDLSFPARPGTPAQRDAFPQLGGSPVLCIPEMIGKEEAFMQTNPAWHKDPAFPIHTLRLFSIEPLPKLKAEDIHLRQSRDNITYSRVADSSVRVTVKKLRRANGRWTPAGIVPEPGTHEAWMIELRGLSLGQPFLSLEIPKVAGRLFHRQFAMGEAIGRDGEASPVLCSDTAPPSGGEYKYDFVGAWPGWTNYNDHAYGWTSRSLRALGLAFLAPRALTGVLEPTHPAAQKIWQDRVEFYLDHDIEGISIRTLCHHRRCPSWLQYAFGPSVREAFQSRYGRPPTASDADCNDIRRLRGEALGDFLSWAAARIRAKKKKSIFQVETGGELPPERESRMAMFYDYERWISSGLFDELHVRSISAHSPWLRRTLLPLARKHGVEVHLMTRNHATGFGQGDLLDIQKITHDAKALGYGGVNFYEAANLYEFTAADTLLPRAMGEHCARAAVRIARSAPL